MRKVGLFVGIGQYADEEITPLAGAANDATELAALFKRNLGFETHVLTHDKLLAGEESLKHKVVELTKPLGADDLFVFYFAGHGLRHQIDPARPQQLFLLPNAELNKVHAGKLDVGVITLQFLKDYTDREGLRRAFVFDVCRDELRVDKAHTRAGASDFAFDGEVVFRNLVLGQGAAGGGALPPAILNSCCDAQRAVELRGKGRGLFSLALDDLIGERVKHSQPVVLNAGLVDELTARMRALWPAAERIDLRPCLVAKSEVRLFEPPSATDGRQARLLELFDEQLAKGQLDAPAGRCARDTLNQLVLLGAVDEAVIDDLSQRLQAAVDRVHDDKLIQRARRTGLAADYDTYLVESRLREHVAEAEAAKAAAASDAADTDEDGDDDRTEAADPGAQLIVTPSRALAAIIGDDPLPRTEVTGRLWAHIKTHNLQDPNDKKIIVTDAALASVCDGRKRVSMFDLTDFVNKSLEVGARVTPAGSQGLVSDETVLAGSQDSGGATSAARLLERTLASRPRSIVVWLGLTAAYWLGLAVSTILATTYPTMAVAIFFALFLAVPAGARFLVWFARPGAAAFSTVMQVFFSSGLALLFYLASLDTVLFRTSLQVYCVISVAAIFVPLLLWVPAARNWFADVAAARALLKQEVAQHKSVEAP
jgi:upstream activation factor subunit UAF30